jgi:hypothetical protein
MPTYVNSPFSTAQLAQKGVPCYLFGKYNYKQANTKMLVSNVALTSNVATLTVQITAGEVPIVGALISVAQTQSTAGLFNVNRVPLASVTIDATTGAGTVTFALTHADVVSAADTGSAIVEVPEIGETPAAVKSAACYISPSAMDAEVTITTAVTFSTVPTAITVKLQKAERDVDSEYTTITGDAAVISASAYTTGPVVTYTLQGSGYYRFIGSGLTLGSGAGMVAKLTRS